MSTTFAVSDSNNYRYQVHVAMSLGPTTTDTTQLPPGSTGVRSDIAGSGQLTNQTSGRDAPIPTGGVAVFSVWRSGSPICTHATFVGSGGDATTGQSLYSIMLPGSRWCAVEEGDLAFDTSTSSIVSGGSVPIAVSPAAAIDDPFKNAGPATTADIVVSDAHAAGVQSQLEAGPSGWLVAASYNSSFVSSLQCTTFGDASWQPIWHSTSITC